MAARRPFWKWQRWKSIGFCLWPPSTCIWNLKLKFQSKLDLCSGNHVVYRQTDGRTDGRTDKVNPVYPPSNFVGRGYNNDPDLCRHMASLGHNELTNLSPPTWQCWRVYLWWTDPGDVWWQNVCGPGYVHHAHCCPGTTHQTHLGKQK